MKQTIARWSMAAFFALLFIAGISYAQPKTNAPTITVYQDPT